MFICTIAGCVLLTISWKILKGAYDETKMGNSISILLGFFGVSYTLLFFIPIYFLVSNFITNAKDTFRKPEQTLFFIFAGIGSASLPLIVIFLFKPIFFFVSVILSGYFSLILVFFPLLGFGIVWWLMQHHNNSNNSHPTDETSYFLIFTLFIMSGIGVAICLLAALQYLSSFLAFGVIFNMRSANDITVALITIALVVWRMEILHSGK
jgi:hypothetical protein